MPSDQELESKLKEAVSRALNQKTEILEKQLHDLRNQFAASTEGLQDCLGSIGKLEIDEAYSIIEDAYSQANREYSNERERVMGYLAHYAHNVRRKETQEEILSFLLDSAHIFAPKVALFVTRGDEFLGWASRGFSEELAEKISGLACRDGETQILSDAMRADGLVSINHLSHEKALSDALQYEAEAPWHAFPMKAIQKPVAVLLAAPAEGRECDLEALCIMMDLTGLSVENIALKILQEINAAEHSSGLQQHPGDELSAPLAPPSDTLEESLPETEIQATDIIDAPETVEPKVIEPEIKEERALVSSEDETAETELEEEMEEQAVDEYQDLESTLASEEESTAEAEIEEEMEEQAADEYQAQESTTASAEDATAEAEFKDADFQVHESEDDEQSPQVADQQEEIEPESEAPASETAESEKSAFPKEVEPPSEEEKLHTDAKRFARLLVSEIKLYNERSVSDGRQNHDLYVRLKRDVDRSREMYEERISTIVARKVDYFHDEVVRILAENDPSMLGSDYPGPRVEN